VTVRSARYGPLVDMLKRRELDVTLLWDYPWAQVDDPDLAVTRLLRDPVLLLLPASHPLARKRSVALGALREEQWITRSEHPVADVLFRLCAEAGFEPRVAFAANDYQEAQGMVAAGIGICLIPRLAATVLRHDVRVVPITGDPAPRRVLLARLRDRRPTPPEAAAVEVLRSCATDLPGVEQRRPPG
jgi:DNA-binding transcriptional LysR family regulator